MADDTRLAEACLLLNYSNRSYMETQTLAAGEECQQNVDSQQNQNSNILNEHIDCKLNIQHVVNPNLHLDITTNNNEAVTEENNFVTTKLMTPSPESEINFVESLKVVEGTIYGSNINGDDNTCLSDEFNNNDYVTSYEDQDLDHSMNVRDPDTAQVTSANKFSLGGNEFISRIEREPIQNLLAAVNYALPSIRANTRPTILKRSSSLTKLQSPSPCPSASSVTSSINTCHPSLPDHDYCQQENRRKPSMLLMDSDNSYTKDAYEHIVNSAYKRTQLIDDAPKEPRRPLRLLAVHLGASRSSHDDSESLKFAKNICEELMNNCTPCDEKVLVSKLSRKQKKFHVSSSPHQNETGFMSAEDAVVQLVRRMEDNHSLNCGYGSNLNMNGQVECDASLMCDKTQMWTGVGAVPGCKNPILLAKCLYDQRTIARPLGLIQPNLLVGSGAKQWMRENCPHLLTMDSRLISSKAFSMYQKLKSRYDAIVKSANTGRKTTKGLRTVPKSDDNLLQTKSNRSELGKQQCYSTILDHGFYCIKTSENLQKVPSFAEADLKDTKIHDLEDSQLLSEEILVDDDDTLTVQTDCMRFDTVGAVAVDYENNFASAVSSGGLLLKYKGRLGQAAVPGAGCWSEDSVAITTTGVGEYLTLNLFARKFYDKMLTLRLLHDLGHVEKQQDLSDLISCGVNECYEDFLKSPALAHSDPSNRLAGMLAVTTLNSKDCPYRVNENDLYLSYAHNTKSMCIGYITCNDTVGHSVMSRKPTNNSSKQTATGFTDDSDTVVRTIKFSIDTN